MAIASHRTRFTVRIGWVVAYIGLLYPDMAEAQLGQTRGELQQTFFETHKTINLMDGVSSRELGVEAFTYESRANHRYCITVGFQNDRAVLAQLGASTYGQQLPWTAVLALLGGSPPASMRRPKTALWEIDGALLPVFPPVGEYSIDVWPILNKTIIQARAIAVDARTRQIVAASPWGNLGIPTGSFWVHRTDTVLSRVVLRRRDGQAYAIIELANRRSHARKVTSSGYIPSSMIHELGFVRHVWVFRSDVFWQFLLTVCTQQPDKGGSYYASTSYEGQLRRYVPAEWVQHVRQQRLIRMVIAGIYQEGVPMPLVLASAKELPAHLLVAAAVAHITKDKPEVAVRKLAILELFGTKQSLALCCRMLRKSHPPTRAAAIKAILAIAGREKLAADADMGDDPAKWQQWARQVAAAGAGGNTFTPAFGCCHRRRIGSRTESLDSAATL